MSKARDLADGGPYIPTTFKSVAPVVSVPATRGLGGFYAATIVNGANLGEAGTLLLMARDSGGGWTTATPLEVPYSDDAPLTDVALYSLFADTGTHTVHARNNSWDGAVSDGVTTAVPAGAYVDATFRYFRMMNPVLDTGQATSAVRLNEWSFYTAPAKGGTNIAFTPTAGYTHSATYEASKVNDGSITSMWWGIGHTGPLEDLWVQADLGSSQNVKSMALVFDLTDAPLSYEIWGSNTGAFAGEETLVVRIDPNTAVDISASRYELVV